MWSDLQRGLGLRKLQLRNAGARFFAGQLGLYVVQQEQPSPLGLQLP